MNFSLQPNIPSQHIQPGSQANKCKRSFQVRLERTLRTTWERRTWQDNAKTCPIFKGLFCTCVTHASIPISSIYIYWDAPQCQAKDYRDPPTKNERYESLLVATVTGKHIIYELYRNSSGIQHPAISTEMASLPPSQACVADRSRKTLVNFVSWETLAQQVSTSRKHVASFRKQYGEKNTKEIRKPWWTGESIWNNVNRANMTFLYLCRHCVDVTCISCYIIVSSGIKYPSYFSIFFPPHGFPRLLQAYRCWCSPSAPRPEWSPHRSWATTAILPNCLGIQKTRFQNAFHLVLVGKSTRTHQQQVSTNVDNEAYAENALLDAICLYDVPAV